MKINLQKQTGAKHLCDVLGCAKQSEWILTAGERKFLICHDCAKSLKLALKNLKDKNGEEM